MDDKSISEIMKLNRKCGAASYTYSANTVLAVNSGNGKVIVTVRNDQTGELIMDEKCNLDDVKENGLPMPGLKDL